MSSLWSLCVSKLEGELPAQQFNTWIRPLQAIEETGPDGNYIINEHTLRNFRGLWRPKVFSRLGGEAWEKKGNKKTSVLLREKTISLMESHKPEPLPDRVRQNVAAILEKSKEKA